MLNTQELINSLRQSWDLPSNPRPIVLIGAGMIVNDVHLPAYRKAQFKVGGIFDIIPEKSKDLAEKFEIPRVFESLDDALATKGVVFDVAVPPSVLPEIVEAMPEGAIVLMQKPMGVNLEDARRIRRACREKKLTGAVNFQLRFSSMGLALRDLWERGLLGDLVDVEFQINILNPWELFGYLKSQKRVEMMICSIHYFDYTRSILGEPKGVHALSIPHPNYPDFEASRSSVILDYGPRTRVMFGLNDAYEFGPDFEDALGKFVGTEGAAVLRLGPIIGYPNPKPDGLFFCLKGGEWTEVPLKGQWFPDAFIGTMSNIQRFAAGEDEVLLTHYEDAYKTMALVEALYESNEKGGTPIPD